MKPFKILSHPYTLILCFSFMIISGESMGGFYVMFILLGLLQGVLHSLLGFYGMLLLVIGYHLPLRRNGWIKPLLSGMGVLLMAASVYFFFSSDTARYNWGTFSQGFPLFTLIFTAFVALCCMGGIFWKPRPKDRNDLKHGFLSKV